MIRKLSERPLRALREWFPCHHFCLPFGEPAGGSMSVADGRPPPSSRAPHRAIAKLPELVRWGLGVGFGTVLYTNRIGFLERYSTKHVRLWGLKRNGENPMKILIATFAMTLALAFSGPVFAGAAAAKTEADCAKAGGTWNATIKMCEEKKM